MTLNQEGSCTACRGRGRGEPYRPQLLPSSNFCPYCWGTGEYPPPPKLSTSISQVEADKLPGWPHIWATYNPKIRETLRNPDDPQIGQRAYFERLWMVTDEDGGPYVGQYVWDGHGIRGWVPTEDLDDITIAVDEI